MAKTKSGTLTPNTAVAVPITNHGGSLEIVNRSSSGEIWIRVDGTPAVVEADDNYVVLGYGARRLPVTALATQTATASLISTEALEYTVEAGE